jgi:hypothetical protein
MNDKDKQNKTTRRRYQKPKLESVRLVTEEAVLTFCKTAGSAGSYGGPNLCQNPSGNTCSALGS